MIILRGVNVFPTQIEEQILRDPQLSGNYLLVLTREGHLDHLEVRCELQRAASGRLSDAERAAIGRELQHRIKTFIGVSTRVTVLDADTLPRTQTGKARRVQDERPRVI
jgi:phenylacetate-CoA ligase